MTKHVSTPWAILAILIALLAMAFVLGGSLLSKARIDLTDGNLYSLSDGSKQILGELTVPTTLRLYFSEKAATGFPGLQSYAQRVEDLLAEYAAASGGTINYKVIDPEPFSEAEDEAVAYGLQGARGGAGETIYFGLVGTNAVDGQEVIAFLAQEREAFLEYDLTQLISKLGSQKDKAKLALITDLPMQFGPGGPMAMAQGRAQPYVTYEQLSQSFDVSILPSGFDRIAEDIDLAVIAHAPSLGPKQYYAIDQFVLRGGNAMVFVDPHSEVAAASQQVDQMGMPRPGGIDTTSDLGPLLEAWGISYDPELVVLDLEQAQRVNMGARAQSAARQIVDYVAWVAVAGDNVDSDDLVTAELEQVNLAAAGHLQPVADTGLSFTPLLTSSDTAGVTNASEVRGDVNPDRLIQTLLPTGETYVLAARITGPAKTAYPNGQPDPDAPGEEDTGTPPTALPAPLAQSAEDINVIVVADADMLADNFWAQVQDFFGQRMVVPLADNGRFLLNAADNMSGADALISLRSRGTSSRPFTVIEDMRRDAERDFSVQQQMLQNNLNATEARLAELEGENPDGDVMVSDEQLAEIDRFRADLLETRKQLRSVQRSLNLDIERLQSLIIWLNILAVPVLLVVVSSIALWRRKKGAR